MSSAVSFGVISISFPNTGFCRGFYLFGMTTFHTPYAAASCWSWHSEVA